MSSLSPIQEAHLELASNYVDRLEKLEDWETEIEDMRRDNLIAFWKLAVERILNWELPDDKMWRWIWYLQWVLISRWLVSVNEERDRTRPIFHEAYEKSWIKPPETKEIKK